MINDIDTTETRVRDAFERLVGDEPPMHVDACAVIEARRRASHHTLVFRAAVVAAAVAAATAGLATTVHHSAPHRAATPSTAARTANPALRFTAAHGQVFVGQGGAPAGAVDEQMIAAIKGASPSGWTFEFGGGGTSANAVDGTANDGAGPGRVYVFAESAPGSLTREPCGDSDFVAGATCTETHLAGDAILSVRGLVDYQGIKTYEISLTHADGTGVGAEAGNFTLPTTPKDLKLQVKIPDSKARFERTTRPTISRPAPTYDASQLAAVVEAVDRVAHA